MAPDVLGAAGGGGGCILGILGYALQPPTSPPWTDCQCLHPEAHWDSKEALGEEFPFEIHLILSKSCLQTRHSGSFDSAGNKIE